MKFSVCIPNYNYEKYLGRTIQSVLDQTEADFEVLVSDNASTDHSMDVVHSFNDPRIRSQINACNVGFAGNLDRVGRMAGGDRMMLLSSDDLLRPGTLATYRAFFESLGPAGMTAVASAAVDVIDSDDRPIGRIGLPANSVWNESDRAPELDTIAGGPVYRVAGRELLRRCLLTMQNPFQFAATIYPRSLYEAVEGYGGGRQLNPDKWFHWKLLSKADMAFFIDRSLSAYRWHSSNQASLQAGSGALKYLVDEYVSTFEIDGRLLQEIGLQRAEVERAFIEYDIGRHGLATLGRGQRRLARRIYHYGKAVYPQHTAKNRYVRVLRLLLALGPFGQAAARAAYRYRTRESRAKAENAWELTGSYR
ncbi:MAG TPA: glycosyltransferase family A protein [Pirellulales bacterium]|jgi:glycosyltransferase involved in cell wall biosynthesis|nr:glycosyltransferase family A protein [Pirellulales bacterium]